jgi:hypothetical protein
VGIAILGDSIALVVERGNRRVQGFHLPDFTSVGTFGERLFVRPVAIGAYPVSNAYEVVIADNDGASGRIVQFRLTVGNGELIAIHWRTFGAADALASVLSIAADAHHNVLLIDAGGAKPGVKIFDLEGRNSHVLLGDAPAPVTKPGLVDCGAGAGYWIAPMTSDAAYALHVFERHSRRRIGAVVDSARRLLQVVGVVRGTMPVLWGLRADSTLASFDWGGTATRMGIPGSCQP